MNLIRMGIATTNGVRLTGPVRYKEGYKILSVALQLHSWHAEILVLLEDQPYGPASLIHKIFGPSDVSPVPAIVVCPFLVLVVEISIAQVVDVRVDVVEFVEEGVRPYFATKTAISAVESTDSGQRDRCRRCASSRS